MSVREREREDSHCLPSWEEAIFFGIISLLLFPAGGQRSSDSGATSSFTASQLPVRTVMKTTSDLDHRPPSLVWICSVIRVHYMCLTVSMGQIHMVSLQWLTQITKYLRISTVAVDDRGVCVFLCVCVWWGLHSTPLQSVYTATHLEKGYKSNQSGNDQSF